MKLIFGPCSHTRELGSSAPSHSSLCSDEGDTNFILIDPKKERQGRLQSVALPDYYYFAPKWASGRPPVAAYQHSGVLVATGCGGDVAVTH